MSDLLLSLPPSSLSSFPDFFSFLLFLCRGDLDLRTAMVEEAGGRLEVQEGGWRYRREAGGTGGRLEQ